MAAQTTITLDPAEGVEGMLYDSSSHSTISRALADAAGIGAGRVVKDGTIGDTCAALTASGDVPIGVTMLDLEAKEPANPRFKQYDDIALLTDGYIFMTCVDDMRAVKGPVYICFSGANAGLPQASSVGADLVPQIRCLRGGNTGALGIFHARF